MANTLHFCRMTHCSNFHSQAYFFTYFVSFFSFIFFLKKKIKQRIVESLFPILPMHRGYVSQGAYIYSMVSYFLVSCDKTWDLPSESFAGAAAAADTARSAEDRLFPETVYPHPLSLQEKHICAQRANRGWHNKLHMLRGGGGPGGKIIDC